jgi:hypothetical protein
MSAVTDAAGTAQAAMEEAQAASMQVTTASVIFQSVTASDKNTQDAAKASADNVKSAASRN